MGLLEIKEGLILLTRICYRRVLPLLREELGVLEIGTWGKFLSEDRRLILHPGGEHGLGRLLVDAHCFHDSIDDANSRPEMGACTGLGTGHLLFLGELPASFSALGPLSFLRLTRFLRLFSGIHFLKFGEILEIFNVINFGLFD